MPDLGLEIRFASGLNRQDCMVPKLRFNEQSATMQSLIFCFEHTTGQGNQQAGGLTKCKVS